MFFSSNFSLSESFQGEELTFDYNYVRVFGAAAKKCFCGSSQCRGYIGGDPLTSEGIVQCDSDEEHPEPVMVNEDGMITNNAVDDIISMPTSLDNTELENSEGLNDSEKLDKETQADIGKVKIPGEDESSVEIETENPSVKENFIRNDSVQSLETSLVNTKPETLLSESVDTNQKSKCDTSESKRVFIKSRFILKPSRSSVKKWKSSSSNPVIANKSQLFSSKPKKVVEGAANGRFEAVEEKLNELLDSNGGISKRKVCTFYLYALFKFNCCIVYVGSCTSDVCLGLCYLICLFTLFTVLSHISHYLHMNGAVVIHNVIP